MKYSKPLILILSLTSLSVLMPFMAKGFSLIKENNSISQVKNKELITIKKDADNPKIQIAILLDSSNSMDGLIEQTRTQIWQIVNALTDVKKNGKTPILEVSLYHYGNNALPSEEGFTRLLSQFTSELDLVSQQLFAIKTNGGEEYAGWVIDSAMKQLNWSDNSDDFRVIFIAGNEPFNQGNIDWQESIQLAKNKDILVNTIYCGEAENEESRLWAKGAETGKGSYFNINQNQQIVDIPTPYDDEIAKLNDKLNDTYIPYGEEGKTGQERQQVEDANSRLNSSAGLSRAITKSSGYYRNSSWDLVDAMKDNLNLDEVDKNALPEDMRNMTSEEKKQYVEQKKSERETIQSKIAELSQQRTSYIQKNTSNQGQKDTLDYVMIEALRKQLLAKGFILNQK